MNAITITAAVLWRGTLLLGRGVRAIGARVGAHVATVLRHRITRHRPGVSPGSGLRISGSRMLARRQVVTGRSWLPVRSGAVVAVRCDLHRDLRGAKHAVAVGLESGRPVEPLAAITARLQRSADVIDVDLTVIAAEPDATVRRTLLAEQDERIHALRRACEQVRRGVLLAGSATSGPLLPIVVDDLNDEAIRLG